MIIIFNKVYTYSKFLFFVLFRSCLGILITAHSNPIEIIFSNSLLIDSNNDQFKKMNYFV